MSFLSAYLEGEQAQKDGKSLDDCPYNTDKADNDFDKWDERERRDWWIGGFNDAKEESL